MKVKHGVQIRMETIVKEKGGSRVGGRKRERESRGARANEKRGRLAGKGASRYEK